MIIQCEKCFATIDNTMGIRVWSYEGRLMSNPKFSGLRPEFLNRQNVSISDDVVAVIDRANPKTIRVFDASSGKDMGEPIQTIVTTTDIVDIEQSGILSENSNATNYRLSR